MLENQMWWNFSTANANAYVNAYANASSLRRTASLSAPGGISKHAAPALALCVLLSLRFIQLCAPNYRWLCRRVYVQLFSGLHAYTKIRRNFFAVADSDSGTRSVPGVLGVGSTGIEGIDAESAKSTQLQSPSFPLLEILVEDRAFRAAAPANTMDKSSAAAHCESDTRLRCKLSNRTGLVAGVSGLVIGHVNGPVNGPVNGRDSGLVRNRSSTALFMV